MKAFFTVTGRGLGGDAVVAINTMEALRKRGVECEIGLNETASGDLFEKNGFTVRKISIPHAGGHAATKLSAIKGALKLLTATFKARSAIRKSNADFVVGVLGGVAIVGSLGAKFAGKPCISLISTPLDSKVCPKFNSCYVLPELDKFRLDPLPKNMERSFYPLTDDIGEGDEDIALQKLKEYPNFDENKKTIIFSSGSSIFKGMIDAMSLVAGATDKYNLVLIGRPLKEEYYDLIDEEKVVYVGFIDWVKDLFKFADLAVLTDDGVSLEEAMICEKPIIALTRVKWGRYQNMAGVFKGAIIESEVTDVCKSIQEAFENYDSLKENAEMYGKKCFKAADSLADGILKKVE